MIRAYRFWRKVRRYPKVNQVIKYHGTLVRVIDTRHNRDDVKVRWYDSQGKHEELVSWSKCCELA